MERVIPKNSKLKAAIFKSFTLFDLLIACGMLLIAILIFFADFANKLYVLAGYIVVCIVMFIGDDEDRTYSQLSYMIRFYVSRRTYIKDAKRGSTDELIPFKNIREDGIIEYDGYCGMIVEIGSIDFALLDEDEQDRRIATFARVLNGLSQASVIQLIKLDRPIKYDEVSSLLFEKLSQAKSNEEDVKEIGRAHV